MKFAHLGDCHLGGWRFPELQELNMQSFSKALSICIKEPVDMVLIAGDLFDSPYPSIDILKKTFAEFKKLNDSKIPCFIIAGSHDYSVSGKSFLDVLEHAGFCKNVSLYEEKDNKIMIHPTIYKDYAIYGYPGKKAGLEVQELKRIHLQDSPGFFKILMLHTTIKEAIGTLPIESISLSELPNSDYYALSHLHVDFSKSNASYSGPVFPNNFEELEELKQGRFYIIEVGEFLKSNKIDLNLKEVLIMDLEINDSLTATEKIIAELSNQNLEDKIILLRLRGSFQRGKISDIDFNKIEKFAKDSKAYIFIKNTSKLISKTSEINIDIKDVHKVEEEIINKFLTEKKSQFTYKIPELLKILNIEKQEDETNQIFQDRLVDELQKTLNF